MSDAYAPSLQRQVPSIIYHYTRREGLQGIFNSRALWATSIRYLNDASEFLTAVQVAESVLDEIGRKVSEDYKRIRPSVPWSLKSQQPISKIT